MNILNHLNRLLRSLLFRPPHVFKSLDEVRRGLHEEGDFLSGDPDRGGQEAGLAHEGSGVPPDRFVYEFAVTEGGAGDLKDVLWGAGWVNQRMRRNVGGDEDRVGFKRPNLKPLRMRSNLIERRIEFKFKKSSKSNTAPESESRLRNCMPSG